VEIYDRPFSLSHDLALLEEAIKRMKAILVVLDPLTAVLGDSFDASRDQQVREVFSPLSQLAERTGCAIVIIRHLNRSSSGNPLYRGAGPISIIAAARTGLIVVQDPDDPSKRILATTKNNLTQLASNLTYQIAENERGVPYIQWLGENHHTLADLMNVGTHISTQRRDILRVLKDSTAPLGPQVIAERTGQDYERVRKMLTRMLKTGELACPARGQYTTPGHLIKNKKNSDVSSEASVTTETTVTTVPTSDSDRYLDADVMYPIESS